MADAPTFAHVRDAAERLRGYAHRTPVMISRTVDEATGASVFFKCENLQRMGAFKFRGAFNALARLDAAARARGVVTFSSGNHAQAVALAARLLGTEACIVMPGDAPRSKVAATLSYGARIVEYDRYRDSREAIATRLAAESGATVIPPFDHADVIAGQGTATLELLEEVGTLDRLYVCLGGGGLLAGAALCARALAPDCKVVGVEPEAGNDGQQSLRTGSRVSIPVPHTIADGAQTQCLGALTFEIIRREVAEILTVGDAELIAAMAFALERMKMVVEPTGCLGFAAVRALGPALRGQRVGVILSGGNIDARRLAGLLGSSAEDAHIA